MFLTMAITLTLCSLLIWLMVALRLSCPYRYSEVLHTDDKTPDDCSVTAVVPARNEEDVLAHTLPSLLSQGYPNLDVVLVDDNSSDSTLQKAQSIGDNLAKSAKLEIVVGKPLAAGWAGKMWALSQGISQANGEWLLLTDADIEYPPGMLASLMRRVKENDRDMLSLMARLSTASFWEKMLIPAFLYFFKQLYPFKAVNNAKSSVAAAAGGCVLIRKQTLEAIGGIEAIKDELIDDIALARAIKSKGFSIMLLDAPELLSRRCYQRLSEIWRMVSRSAFTELKYSYLRLSMCILAMTLAFVVPIFGMVLPLFCGFSDKAILVFAASMLAYGIICFTYLPTIRYFSLSMFFALFLPLAGIFYLAMTVDSAMRYSFGLRSSWKDRNYASNA